MPLFTRRASSNTDEFHYVCTSERIATEGMVAFKVNGSKVILTRFEGQIYAIDSICPHAAADLARGTLRSWQLCCHEHDYCFDIRTGLIVWPEDEAYRLRRYDVKEEEGQVFVRLTSMD